MFQKISKAAKAICRECSRGGRVGSMKPLNVLEENVECSGHRPRMFQKRVEWGQGHRKFSNRCQKRSKEVQAIACAC
jgi:hypothetical protein